MLATKMFAAIRLPKNVPGVIMLPEAVMLPVVVIVETVLLDNRAVTLVLLYVPA